MATSVQNVGLVSAAWAFDTPARSRELGLGLATMCWKARGQGVLAGEFWGVLRPGCLSGEDQWH